MMSSKPPPNVADSISGGEATDLGESYRDEDKDMAIAVLDDLGFLTPRMGG